MSRRPQETELGPGDYAFLGFLSADLQTAYEIKKAMEGSISYFWTAAHSQVYQQAARLERDGFVRAREEDTGRRRKLLSLTPKGRTALKRWLTEAPAELFDFRDEMLVKLFFTGEGDAARMRQILTEHRTGVAILKEEFEGIRAELEPFAASDARTHHGLLTLKLGLRFVQTYLEWIDETLEEL